MRGEIITGVAVAGICSVVLWFSRRSASKSSGEQVMVRVGPKTRLIISTSGRPRSLRRYQILLQELLGLDIAYVPISSATGKIDPQHFSWALRGMNCIGGAISKDIKHTIIPFLDEVDELAQKVQSVNTVVHTHDSRLVGYNTDAMGFRQAIKGGISASKFSIKTAVVYGYGGVSSVVFHVLKELGIQVFVTGRRIEQARARAEEFDVQVFERGSAPCDLFVNATPVTDTDLNLAKNFLPALKGSKCAFDHEMPGRCLKEYCDEHNIFHIPGTAMYYPQMSMQWEMFLPDKAEVLTSLLVEADAAANL
jgi:shikimate 5-dehydrogenase